MIRALIEINPLPTWIYDSQTLEILDVNKAAVVLWGSSKDDLIKLKLYDLLPKKEASKLSKAQAEGTSKENAFHLIISIYQKQRETSAKWEVFAQKIVFNNRQCVLAVGQEVLDKSNELDHLHKEEERLSLLNQGSSDLIGIIDKEGYYTYMSPSSETISGIKPEVFIGKSAFDFIHPNDTDRVLASLKNVRKTGRELVAPFRVKNHNNEWRWIETVLTNKLDHPAINGIIVNTRDITHEQEEKQRLKLFESVITHTKDAVLITEAEPLDEPGPRILYVNEAFTKMTGYTAEEVIGKTPRILQGPDSNYEELSKLGRAIRKWEPYEVTTLNYKKNGDRFWSNFTVTPVADEKGWYTHWIAVERDVTESKLNQQRLLKAKELAEENERKMNEAQKLAHLGSWYYDVINKKSEWSAETYRIWGLDPSKTSIDLVDHEKLIHPSDWERFNTVINEATEKGIPYKMELRLVSSEGFYKTVNTIGAPIFDKKNEKVLAFRGTTQDITDRIAIENDLRAAKDKAEKSGYAMSRASYLAKIGYWHHDFATNELSWGDFIYQLYGLDSNDATLGYEEAHSYYDKQSKEKVTKATKELIEKGSSYDLELRLVNVNNEEFYIRKVIEPVYNQHNEVVGQRGVLQDITESRHIEQLNKDAARMVKIGSWSVDMVNQIAFWSEQVHEMHETDSATYVPNLEQSINFYREDFREMVRETIENTLATGEQWDFEAVIVTAKKNELWIRAVGNADFVDGKCVRLYGGFQDIHNRKVSENRLVSLSQNLPGITYQYHLYPDGTDALKHVSGKVEEVWGYTAKELMADMGLAWKQIEMAGKLDEVQESIRKSIETKSKWQSEISYVNPISNELRTHLGFGNPTFLADGTVIFDSIILDITEQARNKTLLEQTNKAARIGSWEMDLISPGEDSMYWSPMLKEILELNDNYQPTLTGGVEFYTEESKQLVQEAISRLISDGAEFDLELLLTTAKGKKLWIRAIGSCEIVNNKPIKIYGTFQDINKQKLVEEKLADIAERLRLATTAAEMGIWDWDVVKDQLTWDDKMYALYGVKKEDFSGAVSAWQKGLHPDDAEKATKDLNDALAGKREFNTVFRVIWPDDSVRYIEGNAVVIRDAEGSALRVIGSNIDITNRIKSEEENRFKANLLQTVGQAAIATDLDGTVNYWNRAAELIYGWSRKEAIGKNVNILTPSDVDEEQVEAILSRLKRGKTWSGEFTVQRKNGDKFPVRVSNSPVYDENNMLSGMIGISSDITEEVKSKELLKQYTADLERYNEKLQSIAWTQSHVVRAPLARILGIINLIELHDGKVDDLLSLLEQLKVSSNEMDEIVNKIVKEANEL